MARAWLLFAAGEARGHMGNDGYDDDPDQYYSWDETVSNGRLVAVGDNIVIWNASAGAIGASVVESIEESWALKILSQCPECGSSGLKERRQLRPRFRCYKCTSEFDQAVTHEKRVRAFRSRHDAAWLPLEGILDAHELRLLAHSPKSQLSIRPLDWERFEACLIEREPLISVGDIVNRHRAVGGGHIKVLTRARLGQRAFRTALLREFGLTCAVTGQQPGEVLDAAHLYSYAALGTHDDHGGLLLRRDLHALFDRGLLLVEPNTERVRISAALRSFTDYGSLEQTRLRVDLHPRHREWLARHWDQHRAKLVS